MALLPSISFLLFLFVALPSLPTTEADEQIVQSLPNGGVVSISVVIGLVLTVPTFSSTACPKPTTPLCTSTTSSSTAPAQPSCSAGYTYCPGVGCCSPGSLCQGNACVAPSLCNYAFGEISCGSICCAMDQYCQYPGMCQAAGGGSSLYTSSTYVVTSLSTSVVTYSPPIRPTSSSTTIITSQSTARCSTGFHSCPASLGGGCCPSGRACGSGNLCPPLPIITVTSPMSASTTQPFQTSIPSAMTSSISSLSNTTTVTFISPVVTATSASCASPCGSSSQLCCRPNESCTLGTANQYFCDCLKPCGVKDQLCCGASESCTTDSNSQPLCAASTPPPNPGCASYCGYFNQLCCAASETCTTVSNQPLCAALPTAPPASGCANYCGAANQYCCGADQTCVTSNDVALCVPTASSSACANRCGYYGQVCCESDQCCGKDSNSQAVCTSCNPSLTSTSYRPTSITTVTVTAQESSRADRH